MKYKFMCILFIITILTGCNNGIEPKEHLGEIYTVALDSIMEEDQGLNHDMAFIAIDMSNNDIDESSKKNILNYFEETYKVEVMDATFEQLKEMGLYNPDTTALDGVLLEVTKVEFKSNNTVLLEVSKFRSGLGAIGVEVKAHYKDNKWQTEEVNLKWIS